MNRNLFNLKDYELKGGLRKYLLEAREEGKSYRTMASELSEVGATVGRTAVEEWTKATVAEVAKARRKRVKGSVK